MAINCKISSRSVQNIKCPVINEFAVFSKVNELLCKESTLITTLSMMHIEALQKSKDYTLREETVELNSSAFLLQRGTMI